MIVPIVIVMAVIVVLISVGMQGRAEQQHTEAGHQAFRHFHQVFPHNTHSKKGFRTQS